MKLKKLICTIAMISTISTPVYAQACKNPSSDGRPAEYIEFAETVVSRLDESRYGASKCFKGFNYKGKYFSPERSIELTYGGLQKMLKVRNLPYPTDTTEASVLRDMKTMAITLLKGLKLREEDSSARADRLVLKTFFSKDQSIVCHLKESQGGKFALASADRGVSSYKRDYAQMLSWQKTLQREISDRMWWYLTNDQYSEVKTVMTRACIAKVKSKLVDSSKRWRNNTDFRSADNTIINCIATPENERATIAGMSGVRGKLKYYLDESCEYLENIKLLVKAVDEGKLYEKGPSHKMYQDLTGTYGGRNLQKAIDFSCNFKI